MASRPDADSVPATKSNPLTTAHVDDALLVRLAGMKARVTAAKRTEEHQELLVADLERKVLHRDDLAEAFRDVLQADRGHVVSP